MKDIIMADINDAENFSLFIEIKQLIEISKNNVAATVNSEMTMLYWSIGRAINNEIGQQNRADSYGKQIVATLWRQLTNEYGSSLQRAKNRLTQNSESD